MSGLSLAVLDGELAVVRLDAGEAVPGWARSGTGGLMAVATTPTETSIVCDAAAVPAGCKASPGWRAIAVEGELDHALTGVLASLADPLAGAGVPIFAISTFDTDYVLVPAAKLPAALDALQAAGHHLDGERSPGGEED